jgi:hypothetical protein
VTKGQTPGREEEEEEEEEEPSRVSMRNMV